MNLAGYAIRHKAVTIVFTVLITVAGILSYKSIGQLEDPEFTIKQAVITTMYPGATAEEVEREVTEKLETAVQQLKQLDKVTSISRAGMSIIYAEMEDIYDKDTLPQVWDELRRKVNGVAADLPAGCGMPKINDDFGDVYGIFFAITGDGYTYHDLKEVAEDLRRELLQCEDVGRIDFWGLQTEMVYVEMDRTKMAQLGLSGDRIFNTISKQNAVVDSGDVRVGQENVKLRISGDSRSVEELGDILVYGDEGRMIRLKDIATITRGYYDPPTQIMLRSKRGKKDGEIIENTGIGLGISVVLGGNVVTMGDSVRHKLAELQPRVPIGIDVETIAFQSETVKESVEGFVLNLIEALIIVVVLLIIFMGLREGLIIGVILLLTILATFVGMNILEVSLQRISLGALIIALGMLVDNAIVVAEGIVIKSHEGKSRIVAAEETVAETQWALLGATMIAILAFAAISLSNDTTGEFLGSLFTVIALSLGFSWIFAITVTPYLCVALLPESVLHETGVHNNWFYDHYRRLLSTCIRHRFLFFLIMGAILLSSFVGFKFVKRNFFPDSSRPQFTVDVWFPEGTHIDYTRKQMQRMGELLLKNDDNATAVSTFVGSGAMRFILTYSPEMPSSNYGLLLVDVKDYWQIKKRAPDMQRFLEKAFPDATLKVESFKLGPSGGAVEVRLMGPEIDVLRGLEQKVMAIMRRDPNARVIRSDWGEPVKVASIQMAESRARKSGVSRSDIGRSLKMNYDGAVAGVFREGNNLLPIVLRLPPEQRDSVDSLVDAQVLSGTTGKAVPLIQVADGVEAGFENPVIRRRNRLRTITVSCAQRTGLATTLFNKMSKEIEAIPLPVGYKMEWGGEYERTRDANRKLMANVPLAFGLMFLITVMLFNTFRHPVIIFLGLPLAIIGVTGGLLVFDQPFGFLATLGFLSLAGMLIKNEIVLLDQINIFIAEGREPYQAVVDAAVSRVRPVCMAAFTTVLGMVPLIWDAFFSAMAVTIMGGLTFATVLTLLVVPVLYAALFRVPKTGGNNQNQTPPADEKKPALGSSV